MRTFLVDWFPCGPRAADAAMAEACQSWPISRKKIGSSGFSVQQVSELAPPRRVLRLSSGCAAMKNSARGDSSTGSELKAVEEACREASRTVEPCELCASASSGLTRAKHVLSNVEGTPRPQRSEKNGEDRICGLSIVPFRTWRALRLGGSQFPVFEYFKSPENLSEPPKFCSTVVHAFPQTALGKRGSPVGEQPQPKLGISPAKTPRPQRSENNGKKYSSR